ncbi:hypothetical protein AWC38_SpisGene13447 [Stylophora pistillata]|uniref:Uncharacterized protein n=1 Tax=Stylophora pistillata TaxID=50429 RepID=A0A2B4RZ27_STYPI|nr:hypothetical protein AWC38_SpisGene13447 [Stylophora pistillata]
MNSIRKVLERRLRNIIENWEEGNHVFTNTRESILEYFQTKYNFISGELRNLQSAVTSDEVLLESVVLSKASLFTLMEKFANSVTTPLWAQLWAPPGLVAHIIRAPVVGFMAIKSKLEDKSKIKKAVKIRGSLAIFGRKEVRGVDVSRKELDWKEEDLLSSGAFAFVYRGKIKTEVEEERSVALKVCRESLNPRNASLILNEI